jgi:hypothetical protein
MASNVRRACGSAKTIRERGAVELAIGLDHPRTEAFGNGGQRRLARRDHRTCGKVGIGHGDAMGRKAIADRGFPRGDAAGQPMM